MKISIKTGAIALLTILGISSIALHSKAACNAADGTVIEVDIDKPIENKIFLKGEQIKFETSTTETGVTYVWSVSEGTCDPVSATTADFTTTLKSAGTIKVKLKVTNADNKSCEMTRTIKTLVPEVVKLSWNDDHDLYDGETGSTAITDPVWEKTLAGAVTKDKEGAYTKSGTAKAELEIKAIKSLSYSTSVEVRGRGVADNDENFDSDSAVFHNWTWADNELVLESSELYASVNFYDTLEVQWQYRVPDLSGGWGDWVDMNQSSHKLYTVLADPVSPEATPHVGILAYACEYAANATTPDGVCDDMLSEGFAKHYTWAYDCDDLSSTFIWLISSVGVSGSQHRWESKGGYDRADPDASSGNVGEMLYQRTKSFTPVGGSDDTQEWAWHQWAEAAGEQRDASAATSLSGDWGDYEDELFTDYYMCTSGTPFGGGWVAEQSGQSSGCEVYPDNCDYSAGPLRGFVGPSR